MGIQEKLHCWSPENWLAASLIDTALALVALSACSIKIMDQKTIKEMTLITGALEALEDSVASCPVPSAQGRVFGVFCHCFLMRFIQRVWAMTQIIQITMDQAVDHTGAARQRQQACSLVVTCGFQSFFFLALLQFTLWHESSLFIVHHADWIIQIINWITLELPD